MRFYIGTSGYSYREWNGTIYPEKISPKRMLSFYAQRFGAVEINSSFYRMPRVSVLKLWSQQVPEGFRFALKAPQSITHRKRLKGARKETRDFLRGAFALKDRRGPL